MNCFRVFGRVGVMMLTSALVTIGSAGNAPSEYVDKDSIVLKRDGKQQLSASQEQTSDGQHEFKSRVNAPGVSIQESSVEASNGKRIRENKIVVTASNGESIKVIQHLEANGKKRTQSTISVPKATWSKRKSNKPTAKKSIIKSESRRGSLALKQEERIDADGNHLIVSESSHNDSSYFCGQFCHGWALMVAGGYGHIKHMLKNDGDTGMARVALSRQFYTRDKWSLGLELGIQNGNDMRLDVPEQTLELLGGTAINIQLKPIIDLMGSVYVDDVFNLPLQGFLKAGFAYRNIKFDRDTLDNVQAFDPKIEIGVAKSMNDAIRLMAFYQTIIGSTPTLTISTNPLPANNTGFIRDIPGQQAFFIGLSYHF